MELLRAHAFMNASSVTFSQTKGQLYPDFKDLGNVTGERSITHVACYFKHVNSLSKSYMYSLDTGSADNVTSAKRVLKAMPKTQNNDIAYRMISAATCPTFVDEVVLPALGLHSHHMYVLHSPVR